MSVTPGGASTVRLAGWPGFTPVRSLLRSDAQLQYLMHPEATPSEAQLDRWVDGAVATFLAAYGRGEAAG